MRKITELRVSQEKIVQEMVENPSYMVAADMGVGKTGAALTAARWLLDLFEVNHVLVVAPLLVAEETWPEEIEAWEHTKDFEYEVLTGPAERRENRARRLPELSIINRENLPWLIELWGDDWPYDMLIIDEMSSFKNPTKRNKPTKKVIEDTMAATLRSLPKGLTDEEKEQAVSRALKKVRGQLTRFGALCTVRKYINRVYGLTGTPSPNGLLDLWSQYYILDQGERLFSSISKYRTRWFDGDYMGYKYTPRPGAFEQIVERISDITISMKTEDFVDMPDIVYNTVKVTLPPKVMKQYKKFERTLILEEHDIEAVNNGVLTGKLLQLCIAEGTEVLCERGWVPIEKVSAEDRVWDGVEFVSTKGVKCNGKSNVVVCYGVKMTEDHRVLTTAGWRPAKDVLRGDATVGFDRAEVRLPDGSIQRGFGEKQSGDLEMSLRVWQGGCAAEHVTQEQKPRAKEVLRLPTWGDAGGCLGDTRHDGRTPVGDLAGHEETVPRPQGQGLSQLRRKGDRHARRLVQVIQRILGRCKDRLQGRSIARPERQQPRLQQRKLSLGLDQGSVAQHQSEPRYPDSLGGDYGSRGRRKERAETDHDIRADIQGVAGGASSRSTGAEVKVYDLIDCGPRNRFVVRGNDGPLIVHNCNGSVYDEDGEVIEIHDLKLDALERVIEEAAGTPVLVAYSYQFDLEKLRKRFPKAEAVGETKNLQKRWNAGEIPLLLAHPQAAGHGLNLQYGGYITVWYGLCWSLEYYQQLNKRLHRPGQTRTVFIHHIVAAGTMDERVMEVLPQKDAVQDALIEATRWIPD